MAWLPPGFMNQTTFQSYQAANELPLARHAAAFCTELVDWAKTRLGIQAVVSSNVDYAPDEYLRVACRRLGLPFAVILKEHPNSDYGEDKFRASVRGFRFTGDLVAVFGRRSRDLLVAEGVASPDQVVVTGPPRFDEWIDLRRTPQRRDTAVLFAFSRSDQEGSATFPDVLERFVRVASTGAATANRFVVKCRDRFEQATVERLLGDRGAGVTVTSEESVAALLSRSVAAVGFSSLALTEALLSDTNILSVRFGTCTNDQDGQFDDRDARLRAVIGFVRGPQELEFALRKATPRESRAERDAILEDWFCCPTASYSASLEEALSHLVASGRSRGSHVRDES
jgi:hypothetical protein